MRREGFQIVVNRLQAVEWFFTAQRRAGSFNGIRTVHTYKGVQILQWLAVVFLKSRSSVCRQR